MSFIVKTGNTVEDAVEAGLTELGQTRDQVTIEVLEESTKGFLGLGRRLAKVKLEKKFNAKLQITNFLKELTLSMNVIADISIEESQKLINVNLSGENMGILIGKRGQTLEAIQFITNLAINKGTAPYVNIIIDIENYRERRVANLQQLALNLARRVKISGKSVTLEPMPPYERRIIHYALEKERYVFTKSSGNEPYRYIVIEPR